MIYDRPRSPKQMQMLVQVGASDNVGELEITALNKPFEVRPVFRRLQIGLFSSLASCSLSPSEMTS